MTPEASQRRVVLGTWGLGGSSVHSERPSGHGTAFALADFAVLDAAWELGIRWIDIAQSYGAGNAYGLVSKWEKKTGNSFEAAIKVGRPVKDGRPQSNYQISSLRREIDLGRRHLCRVRAILLKDPPASDLRSGLAADLLSHISEENPDVTVGVASHRILECVALPPVRRRHVLELEYHGLNWPRAARTAETMTGRGWSIWGMQPLAYGFLGYEDRRDLPFGSNDWRSRIGDEWRTNMANAAHAFQASFRRHAPEASPAERAIGFCLANPWIDRVVVGPKTAAQLADASAAVLLASRPCFKETVLSLLASAQ